MVEEALQIADIACALDSKLATAHRLRSWALERLGRSQEAISASRTALLINPNDLTTVTGLGWLLFRSGDNAAAHEVFRDALEFTGESSALMDGFARALFELGRVEEAMEAANKAAQRWPDDAALQASVKRMDLMKKKQTLPPAAPQPFEPR
jgi:Flp pilus assembly protein TadD